MPASLPPETFTLFENFGHSLRTPSYRFEATEVGQIGEVFRLAERNGLTVTLRGAGRSYNDATLNGGGIVLDLHQMKRILEWDAEAGIIRAEPGVTLQQLWQHVLPDGWWPPVVSGTMFTTLGGCLGMNIHGKNNFKMGPFGEHVLEFTALLPGGAEVTCSPKRNRDLFYAMISGLGMLGAFTSITLEMKRVHSGLLAVHAWNAPSLESGLRDLIDGAPRNDYIVGWVDCTARGKGLGRGQYHSADYLPEGVDPNPAKTLQVDYQTLPSTFFGVLPKSTLHNFMRPFMNDLGVWAVNTAKYGIGRNHTFHQSHAAFHFLLDYVPDWERAYGHGGLIQYQSFLPKETALDAWSEMLKHSHKHGMPAFLGVSKRHRPDQFLLSHAVDGFSLAMDFMVTASNRPELARMLEDFDRIVLAAGGRFYFAKNSETRRETARCFLGEETVKRFRALKKRCDPKSILESDLYRRVFGG